MAQLRILMNGGQGRGVWLVLYSVLWLIMVHLAPRSEDENSVGGRALILENERIPASRTASEWACA